MWILHKNGLLNADNIAHFIVENDYTVIELVTGTTLEFRGTNVLATVSNGIQSDSDLIVLGGDCYE